MKHLIILIAGLGAAVARPLKNRAATTYFFTLYGTIPSFKSETHNADSKTKWRFVYPVQL
jgi:hypothetical protein